MKSLHHLSMIALASASFALTSCSPGGRSPSGFLGNYQQMDAGYGTTDAVSSYVKPGVDLKKYDSVIIDPVTTVVSTPGISAEVTDQLAAYLADSMRTQTGGTLKIVSVPSPTTIRWRTALTDVVETRKGGKAVTTVHSNPRVTLTGKLGSAAVAGFVSNVSFEGEILDSVSGERLSALCDHRLGTKREATAATSWLAVRSGANQSAARLWQRFTATRER